MPPPPTMLLSCSADPTHHVHDQMSTKKTPVSRLLETRVLRWKEKRKLNPGGAEESCYFPASHEEHKEFLRKMCHSTQDLS